VIIVFAISCTIRELTTKLSNDKDDHAMHPIYECHENFRESLTVLTATFPEI